MRRFRLIEHTADAGLIAYGTELAEAYSNAAFGMFSLMVDMRTVGLKEARAIEVADADPERLLVSWLNELVFRFDTENILFRRFEIDKFSDTFLSAKCTGEKVDRARHQIRLGIKSVTYHMLQVDPVKKQVRVIFDI